MDIKIILLKGREIRDQLETVFRLMAGEEWGEYEEDWVEEVGEKKMAAVLIKQIEEVGLSLPP